MVEIKRTEVERERERERERESEAMERNTPSETGTAERRSHNSADKAAVFNLVLPLCIQRGALEKKQKRQGTRMPEERKCRRGRESMGVEATGKEKKGR